MTSHSGGVVDQTGTDVLVKFGDPRWKLLDIYEPLTL